MQAEHVMISQQSTSAFFANAVIWIFRSDAHSVYPHNQILAENGAMQNSEVPPQPAMEYMQMQGMSQQDPTVANIAFQDLLQSDALPGAQQAYEAQARRLAWNALQERNANTIVQHGAGLTDKRKLNALTPLWRNREE